MMYRVNDQTFIGKVKALDINDLFECHYEENNGRRSPGAIWYNLPYSSSSFIFLSNDSRFAGGAPVKEGYAYGWQISFNETDKRFDCYFEDLLKIEDNPKFLVIENRTKRTGSFLTKEKVIEYLVKNPRVEVKVYEIANELKPEVSVKFA